MTKRRAGLSSSYVNDRICVLALIYELEYWTKKAHKTENGIAKII